ncbi:hypothetical protein [Polaribacter cellanae]|uniref:Uncharacterized protein n=1 Tax=Polaribacter cellanae TaxID=2818493 RepID=A0A975CJS0_9FLAO|nr:hypothetical protein [Polaribacter cellanae]QTE21186.1 hypothetical protein J3359_10055 [Polaribacter cellanae]
MRQYYNANYVKIAWDSFFGGVFGFLALATAFCDCEERATYKVLYLALASKNCDLKTIEVVASGTKQKTEVFYFFCKNLDFVLWGY